jgi:hypothetical protein
MAKADAREMTDDTTDGRVGILVPDRNGAWSEQVGIAGFPVPLNELAQDITFAYRIRRSTGQDGMFRCSRPVSYSRSPVYFWDTTTRDVSFRRR